MNRLMVVNTAYHQPDGAGPTQIDSRFVREVASTDLLYVRRGEATEEWQPLPSGWMEDASMIFLRNEEGRFQAVPTAEEARAATARVLEVAPEGGEACPWLVRPTEGFSGEPADLRKLRVRCRKGTARFTLSIVPR